MSWDWHRFETQADDAYRKHLAERNAIEAELIRRELVLRGVLVDDEPAS